VIFPAREMTILDYNRTIRDLNGKSPDELLAALSPAFKVEAADGPVRPSHSGEFGLYLAAAGTDSPSIRSSSRRTTRSAGCR
jgi:uncharacterized protein (DUF1015 family)